MLLLPAAAAGCGSHTHALTLDGIKGCLVDAGFVIRGQGRPGAGRALAVRSGEKRGYAFGVVALLDDASAASAYEKRFVGVLGNPPHDPDAVYLKTLVQKRGRLVYGWTTRPPAADIRVLDRCTQAR